MQTMPLAKRTKEVQLTALSAATLPAEYNFSQFFQRKTLFLIIFLGLDQFFRKVYMLYGLLLAHLQPLK